MPGSAAESSDSAASAVGLETWLMRRCCIFATDAFQALDSAVPDLWLNGLTYANSSAGRDNLGMAAFLPALSYEQLTCAV